MELNSEQKTALVDLLTHGGWLIYEELFEEILDAALVGLENADDYDEFIKTQAQVKLLRRLQYLVKDELEEDKIYDER